jgi:hypothetical protein
MDKRTCQTCGTEYPDGKQHFPSKKSPSLCRLCVRKRKSELKRRAAGRRQQMLAKIEQAGIDLYGKASVVGGSNIPHSAEVLERVFQYFGGVAGFSSIMVKQYWDSPPGGSARNRLLETIVRLVSKNVEQGGAKRPLTLWTEEELEAELNARFQEALTSYKGITVDAKALPSPEAEAPTGDPLASQPDGVPERGDQVTPERTAGPPLRGSEAVPPDPEAGGDSPVPGP